MTHEELIVRWPRARALKLRDIENRCNVCGCGDPSAYWRVVLHLLERAEDHIRRGNFYDSEEVALPGMPGVPPSPPLPWLEFAAKVVDALKLTEHGSGIGWAWLTDDGRLLLEFLRDFGVSGEVFRDETEARSADAWPQWVDVFGWTLDGAEPGMWDAYAEWEKGGAAAKEDATPKPEDLQS